MKQAGEQGKPAKQASPYPLRVPAELMADIKSAAKANGRSVNQEIVARLSGPDAMVKALNVLQLKAGDSLVVRCQRSLSIGQARDLEAYVAAALDSDETPVLVLDAGMALDVLRAAS